MVYIPVARFLNLLLHTFESRVEKSNGAEVSPDQIAQLIVGPI